MRFSKLRVTGFKSFVQPTELLIEPGLTGVVGPNGCGKSNLVEALRWVMGETSARGLRGGEMDDVIFAGTGGRAARDLAEVVLHLDGADRTHGVDDEELELARRIARGTGSSYRLNGREVRARDVQLLFADAASGARSAAIVSQGQIGTLVEAKPVERRRLLEDAAAVGGLQARRHEAELKLQGAETNLARLEDLLITLGEQREHLRKQARQAKRYRQIGASLRATEAMLLAGRWQAASAALETAASACEAARERVREGAERLAALAVERDRRAAVLPDLRAREAALEADGVRLSTRLETAAAERTRLAAQADALREREDQALRDQQQAASTLADAGAMLARIEGELADLLSPEAVNPEVLEAATQAAEAAAAASDEAERTLRAALSDQARRDAEMRRLSEQQVALDRRQAVADGALQDIEARLEALDATTSEPAADDTGDTLEAELASAQGATHEAEGALDLASRNAEEARAALAQAEAALRELTDRRRALGAERRQHELRGQAVAERLSELDVRFERLHDRRTQVTEHQHACRDQRAALGLDRLLAAAAEVAERLGVAQAAHETAEADEAALRSEHERLAGQTTGLRAEIQRLAAEFEALAALQEPERGAAPVVDALEVAAGYEVALGAALGDDLLAGLELDAPQHWRADLPVLAAPPLPAGVESLAMQVRAPAALGRRLAQVGVVEAGRAEALLPELAQGQRLVSRDGALWRWDGFVRKASNGDQAARLRQRTRYRALSHDLDRQRPELQRLETALGAAAARLDEAVAHHRVARQAWDEQRAALARAEEAVQAARARAGALDAEHGALEREAAVLAMDLDGLAQTRQELEAELQAAAKAAADDDELREVGRAIAAAEQSVTLRRAAADGASEALEVARRTLAERRVQVQGLRDALAEQAARERESAARLQEQALERARLETERARLLEARGALADERSALELALEGVRGQEDEAAPILARLEQDLGAAREAHAAASAERARRLDRQSTRAARREVLMQERDGWRARAEAAEQRRVELGRRLDAARDALAALERQPAELDEQIARLTGELETLQGERAGREQARKSAEAALAEVEERRLEAERLHLEAREQAARVETRLEQLEIELTQAERAWRERAPSGPVEIPDPPPSAEALAELEARHMRLLAARERLGPVNLTALDEAAELELRVQTLEQERDELRAAIDRLRGAIQALNREGRERLRAAFGVVERHFEALFTRMFGGGQARLVLTDLEDPLAAGLELEASPPGKRLQSLSLLSGGEKALTALALIFAVFLTRPSPLCILDEVDAPLDDANAVRFANLLEELARGTETRFIVITHNPVTMARMDRLYGVTMIERGVSQLVSVDLSTAVALRATA